MTVTESHRSTRRRTFGNPKLGSKRRRLMPLKDDNSVTINTNDIHNASWNCHCRFRHEFYDYGYVDLLSRQESACLLQVGEEIDTVSRGRHLTLDQANEMKYLHCAIKEGFLRLTVVAYHLPRVVSDKGQTHQRLLLSRRIFHANVWTVPCNYPDQHLYPANAARMDNYMLSFDDLTCIGHKFAIAVLVPNTWDCSELTPSIQRKVSTTILICIYLFTLN